MYWVLPRAIGQNLHFQMVEVENALFDEHAFVPELAFGVVFDAAQNTSELVRVVHFLDAHATTASRSLDQNDSSILHLHGQLRLARSILDPDYVVDIGYEPIALGDLCPGGGQLRTAIVWFGEPVPMMDRAREIVASADVLMVIGTSLAVYPAAFLAHEAPSGASVLVVDPKAEPGRVPGAVIHREKAARCVPRLVEELLQKR